MPEKRLRVDVCSSASRDPSVRYDTIGYNIPTVMHQTDGVTAGRPDRAGKSSLRQRYVGAQRMKR